MMMLFRTIFLVSVFVGIDRVEGFAQDKKCAVDCSCTISGDIVDATTDEPIPFATIKVAGTQSGSLSDEEGHFEIRNLCYTEIDIEISHIGYKPVVHHHDIYHPKLQVRLATGDIMLESIIVEGEAMGAGLSSMSQARLSSRELDEVKNRSFGDVASEIAGVGTLKTGQNIVKPVIHGLHSNRVLIINNGVRHEFQNWGTEHAPEIDPSLIDNLQVIKGAATVKYGPEALGGVIVIDPPPMELHEDLNGDVTLTGQSNGRSTEASVELHKGYDRSAFMLQASGVRQGDLQAPDYNLTNTGRREWSAAFGARYHWPTFDLDVYYSHFDQELGLLRSSVNGNLNDLQRAMESEVPPVTESFRYDIEEPNQRVTHELFKISGRWNGEGQSVNAQYAFQVNHRQEFDLRRGSAPSIDLELFSHTVDIDWRHRPLGSWEGSLGIQGIYQDNNNIEGTNTVPFVPNYNNYRVGLFLIEANELNETTTLELGIRYDYQYTSIRGRQPNNDLYRNELTFQNVTATIGMIKKMGSATFRTNLGSAWRPPNVNELYSFGRHQSSFEYGIWRYFIEEPGVINARQILTESDKAAPAEMGMKWVSSYHYKKDPWDVEVTGYVNYIRNYFFTRPFGITNTVRGAFPYFIHDQTNAVFAGIDLSAQARHSRKWKSRVRGSYLYARDVENSDNFIGLPPMDLAYEIRYTQGALGSFKGLELGLEMDYTFEPFYFPRTVTISTIREAAENEDPIFQQDDSYFDFEDPPPGYLLVNFMAQANYRAFDLLFVVQNLTNQRYRNYTDRFRYFADDLGINFRLSLSYNF